MAKVTLLVSTVVDDVDGLTLAGTDIEVDEATAKRMIAAKTARRFAEPEEEPEAPAQAARKGKAKAAPAMDDEDF